jgi:hypothetical protein
MPTACFDACFDRDRYNGDRYNGPIDRGEVIGRKTGFVSSGHGALSHGAFGFVLPTGNLKYFYLGLASQATELEA